METKTRDNSPQYTDTHRFKQFCSEFLMVNNPLQGLSQFIPHNHQLKFVNFVDHHALTICKKQRQTGFSTISIAYLAWQLMSRTNFTGCILTGRPDHAGHMFNTVCTKLLNSHNEPLIYQNFGMSRDRYVYSNPINNTIVIGDIHTDHGCRSYDVTFIDEAAYSNLDHLAIQSIMAASGKVVVISTESNEDPRNNVFEQLYAKAVLMDGPFELFWY